MKYFRVRVLVDTYYDVKAKNEEYAIDKAYEYMVEGYTPRFEVEEIEFEYDGTEKDFNLDHRISTEILNMIFNCEFPHYFMDIDFEEEEENENN